MKFFREVVASVRRPRGQFWREKKKDQAFKAINNFLHFKDKTIEQEYQQYNRPYKRNFLILFQTFSVLWVLFLWILNPLNLNNFQGSVMGFNIMNIGLNVGFLGLIIRKKNFKYIDVALFALQTYLCVGYLETQRKNRIYYQSTNYVLTGIIIEVVLLIQFISRCSWIFNALSSLSLNLYLNFRLTDNDDNTVMKGFPGLVYIANFLLITYGSYMHERFDRLMFYARVKNEENLKIFEQIIKEVLPSSIIVSRGEEIVFYNEETTRLLNIGRGERIEEHILRISLREDNNNYIQTEKDDNAKLIDFGACSNQTIGKSFKELLKEEMARKFKKGFSKYSGLHDSAESANKTIEIKLGRIAWEGADAVIAILTEDYAAQKLAYLREQARYKDRLLATVSHDLRTPLNGIIGILDTALEEISENNEQLRKR